MVSHSLSSIAFLSLPSLSIFHDAHPASVVPQAWLLLLPGFIISEHISNFEYRNIADKLKTRMKKVRRGKDLLFSYIKWCASQLRTSFALALLARNFRVSGMLNDILSYLALLLSTSFVIVLFLFCSDALDWKAITRNVMDVPDDVKNWRSYLLSYHLSLHSPPHPLLIFLLSLLNLDCA